MGKLFADMGTDGLEETEDRLGGGRKLFDTGIYEGNATVKLAYVGKSDRGANFLFLNLDLDGQDYEETIYFTNANGENFYKDKTDGKKQQMPGFVTVNELFLTATGSELKDQEFEERQIEVYDYEEKKKIRQARSVPVDLLGKDVTVAIRKFIENKSKKVENNGKTEYVDTDETREGNEVVKWFHPETRATVSEIKRSQKEGAPPLEAKFIDEWAAKYPADYVMDKRSKRGGTSGSGSGAPPKAGTSDKPKSSLFAK